MGSCVKNSMGSDKADRVLPTYWNQSKTGLTLAESQELDIVFIGYRKAFESVPRRLIGLLKLQSYGISEELQRNFLTFRTMQVNVRGILSTKKPVLCGVPQGSVIGPLLFILDVNELPYKIKRECLLMTQRYGARLDLTRTAENYKRIWII